MNFLRKHGRKPRDLSPAAIREIIVIAVILCVALALSLPQYYSDKEAAKQQEVELRSDESFVVEDPGKHGMDSSKLEAVSDILKSTSALSFLVIKDGSLVYEKYLGSSNNNKNSSNNIYSVTKSIISSLIGIAVREGYIGSLDEPVEKYLPEYFNGQIDPRWKTITLKHLLTMTPGFCEDLNSMTSSKDWIKYTFSLPLNYDPGKKFQYANSASHLLSVILTKATGMSTKDFADKVLFKPLHINSPQWVQDPAGYYMGYANIYLRPRDMARFGWLYCCKGKWEGVQVVPESWVTESTKVQVDFNKEQENGSAVKNTVNEQNTVENGYGNKWWISGKSGYHSFSALGYGGQSITVVPDLGLVMVITSVPDSLSLSDEDREKILKDYVIASIKK